MTGSEVDPSGATADQASTSTLPAPADSSIQVSSSASAPDEDTPSASDAATPQGIDLSNPSIQLSKSQQKKLKRKAHWEATKSERRAAERVKRRESKRRRKEREAEAKERGEEVEKPKEEEIKKDAKWKARARFGATLVVDLGFDELMAEKEISSMRSQLSFLYGANQRAQVPFSSIILTGPGPSKLAGTQPPTSLSGSDPKAEKDGEEASAENDAPEASKDVPLVPAKPHISAELDGYANILRSGSVPSIYEGRIGRKIGVGTAAKGDWVRWRDVTLHEQGGLEDWISQQRDKGVDPKEEIIYLTADTDETIETLEEGKTYIVGGIVDRNRHKNLCLDKARSLGIRVARLPLDAEHLGSTRALNSKAVLTVNQVVQILLGWTHHRSWAPAMDEALPERKFDRKKWERNKLAGGAGGGQVGKEGLARDEEKEGDEEEEREAFVIDVDDEAEEEAFNRATSEARAANASEK